MNSAAMNLAKVLSAPAVEVAPQLLGAHLRHRSAAGVVAVRITEVEAYSGDGTDPAAHTHRGLTARNAVMFGPPGRLYVYFSYGMHWCANVVCAPVGTGEAVLIRAGEVVEGIQLARSRRRAARRDVDLARGPARLTQALGMTGADNGADLLRPWSRLALTLAASTSQTAPVRVGPRVGITKAAELPWRFWLDGEPSVSSFRGAGPTTHRH
ncbi:MAG: DNA-3-methyladenine glycosylase [Geodermatophilaceae bacterium]|nr:DNA-3-methyladenine glycosylase [Geodermatophilaceae bacterium]